MKMRIALLSAACALALSACGNDSGNTDTQTATPPAATAPAATTPAATTPAATPPAQQPAATAPTAAGATTQAPGAAPAAGGVAVVNDCATQIESNDAMQFNVKSIVVPASCTEFTISMHHVGAMPEAAMGHNVVISAQADMAGVNAEGMAAGLENDYVKPDDERVIAHTEIIGGGETTEVTFDVASITDGGPFVFFCSFPGHAALMKGSISVE